MDKIDIRDLRVGNWVYNKFHGRNIKITPFDFFTHGHDPDGYQYIVQNYSITTGRDLEPIPLTAEILEKNRWKKQPIPSTSRKNCIGIWRDSKSVTTIKQFFLDRNSSIFVLIGGYSKVGNIKHVHQLQNILIDVGIEKEIVL